MRSRTSSRSPCTMTLRNPLNRRMRTRMSGGVAGESGRPLPLCRLGLYSVLCTTNPQILCVARRISLGFCLAIALLEVPEGRHKVAHRGSGGEAHKQVPKPRRGGTRSQGCAAPTGLDALPKPFPTTSVVGYVVSSLRDWAGGCCQAAVTTRKIGGLATTVGFGCGSAAL